MAESQGNTDLLPFEYTKASGPEPCSAFAVIRLSSVSPAISLPPSAFGPIRAEPFQVLRFWGVARPPSWMTIR